MLYANFSGMHANHFSSDYYYVVIVYEVFGGTIEHMSHTSAG